MSNYDFFKYGSAFAVKWGPVAGILAYDQEAQKWAIEEYYSMAEWIECAPGSFDTPLTPAELCSETGLSVEQVLELFRQTILKFEERLPQEIAAESQQQTESAT